MEVLAMSRRRPLAALAAVTATLAVAGPAASASAATTTPAAHPAFIGISGGLQSGSLPCRILVGQLQFAGLSGNIALANVLSNVFVYSGCGGAAI
jgi:hypothetical protein